MTETITPESRSAALQRMEQLRGQSIDDYRAAPLSDENVDWLSRRFRDWYPPGAPAPTAIAPTFNGGVAIDFDAADRSYYLDVDFANRLGHLEKAFPDGGHIDTLDLDTEDGWNAIGTSILRDAAQGPKP